MQAHILIIKEEEGEGEEEELKLANHNLLVRSNKKQQMNVELI